MSYVTDFAAEFPTSDYPVLLHIYYTYDQFKQAAIGLKRRASAVLADGGATADEKRQAAMVANSVLSFTDRSIGAFLGDATVLASAASPADADMLTAATWILRTLKSL